MRPSQGSEIFAPKTEIFDPSQCGLISTDLTSTCEKLRSARLGTEASLRAALVAIGAHNQVHIRRDAVMALSEFPRLSFDPFAELRRMQSEMNRVFGGFTTATAREFPSINIWLGETA